MTPELTLPRRIADRPVYCVRHSGDSPSAGSSWLVGRDTELDADRHFDRDAILAQIAELGIGQPVRIRLMSGRRTGGATRWREDHYLVTLSSAHSAYWMSRALHHELEHVRQSELLGGWDPFIKRYRTFQRFAGYRGNPMERDAREAELRHERRPLVVYR